MINIAKATVFNKKSMSQEEHILLKENVKEMLGNGINMLMKD